MFLFYATIEVAASIKCLDVLFFPPQIHDLPKSIGFIITQILVELLNCNVIQNTYFCCHKNKRLVRNFYFMHINHLLYMSIEMGTIHGRDEQKQ